MWRGGVGWAYLLADPFGCRCLTSQTMLRFHIPLFKPDMRFSRIRLQPGKNSWPPDKASRLKHLQYNPLWFVQFV